MKSLEQLLIQARSAVRAAQARVPGLTPRPTRLVLRLNDLHLGPNLLRATGAPLKEKEWRDTIVRFERWLGPLRLTIAGGEPAQSGLLPALVRFGNRLECPTHVVTGGPISPEQAEAMVDWGLSAVTVLVGGIDEVSHRAAVGTRLDEAVATVEAFREARAKRARTACWPRCRWAPSPPKVASRPSRPWVVTTSPRITCAAGSAESGPGLAAGFARSCSPTAP